MIWILVSSLSGICLLLGVVISRLLIDLGLLWQCFWSCIIRLNFFLFCIIWVVMLLLMVVWIRLLIFDMLRLQWVIVVWWMLMLRLGWFSFLIRVMLWMLCIFFSMCLIVWFLDCSVVRFGLNIFIVSVFLRFVLVLFIVFLVGWVQLKMMLGNCVSLWFIVLISVGLVWQWLCYCV